VLYIRIPEGPTRLAEDVMRVRTRLAIALLSTVVLAACETRTSTGVAGGSSATVRLVNATGASLDVVSGSSVSANNGNLGFGAHSSCIGVDATNPNLTVRTTGTTTSLSGFSLSLATGGKYIVIAYVDGAGTTQFATFTTTDFVPSSGQSGLRVFDAATGTATFDVHLTAPGDTLGVASAINLAFASSTNFLGVAGGTVQVRLTTSGSRTVVLDAGNQSLTAAQNYILVIGPPASGTTVLRSFLATAC